ncbi:MAG: enoyl-CoA hydratase-related protein [Pseudomonadota bacterium]
MSIECETRDGLATVRINRPEKRNALNVDMRIQLADTFEALGQDRSVRAVVLCGAGKGFCAGADVELMGGRDIAAGRNRMRHLHRMVRSIYHLEKPVVAAVQGAAVGVGWSLAMCCDAVIAADNARFSQIFKRLALAPDGGAVYLLARQLGFARAKELVLSGRFLNAAEAHTLGLVQQVVTEDKLLGTAEALAREYGSASTLAVGLTKRLFEAALAPSFDEFLDLELMVQPALTQTPDHAEGKLAFQEKRDPVFGGV